MIVDPAVERLVLKAVLSLPSPVLRALSGGGVVWRGGRTLDPRFQFLAHLVSGRPDFTTMSPDEARALNARGMAVIGGPVEAGVRAEDLSIDGPNGVVRLRLYRPAGQDASAPLMVWAHSGGGVIGDLGMADSICSIIARTARCAVLSVDYRLAPDHPFPAGLEDVLAAYRWGRDNAVRFGAAPDVAAVGGDSIGGCLAAVVAQEMRRSGEPQPALQLLIYPVTDAAGEFESMRTYADSFPLPKPVSDWFANHYMGPEADAADPRLSPLRAGDLTGLAPAVVAVAGFDILHDEGAAYADRLRQAGVATQFRCYDALAHGFASFTGVVPAAVEACREIAGLVRAAYDRRAATVDSHAAIA